MPNYDKTGPIGDGPMTGRRAGNCLGNQQNLPNGVGGGFGRGRGRNQARGFRNRCGFNQGAGRNLNN